VALATIATATSAAAEVGSQLTIDNDYLNFWTPPEERQDVGYTSGVELDFTLPVAPHWLKRWVPAGLAGRDLDPGRPYTIVSLRQEIYVPWSGAEERPDNDRPFAGWLELGVGLRRETPNRLREGRFRLGITGPPSLAEDVHNWFHETFGFETRKGWDDQLPAEIGFRIDYEEVRRWTTPPDEHFRVDVGPRWRARLGTMNTDLRLGADLVTGFDPPPVWGGDRAAENWSLYGTAAVRLDVVLRNGFLEGTFFTPSPSVDWIVFVPEIQAGIGAQYRHARLEWRVQRRGREFPDQPTPHSYSSLIFTWALGAPSP
jgi:hypothetical protein